MRLRRCSALPIANSWKFCWWTAREQRRASGSLDEQFPSINVLRLPDHFGATKALNIATRTARGEVLFYLSPEVEVAPGTIANLREKLESASDTAAVCPLLVSPEGKPIWRVLPLPTREIFSQVCSGNAPFTEVPDFTGESIPVAFPGRDAVMVRRNFIAGMNYFDERLGEFWADADLALQIRRAGKKIRVYPEIRAAYHSATISRQPDVAETLRQGRRGGGAAGQVRRLFAGAGFRLGATLKALLELQLRFIFCLWRQAARWMPRKLAN